MSPGVSCLKMVVKIDWSFWDFFDVNASISEAMNTDMVYWNKFTRATDIFLDLSESL